MRVALLVVNPFRDLPALVLTSLHLCQRGCTCYLVPLYLRNREIWTLAPDFVLLHNLRVVMESFTRRLLAAGIQAGVLDCEGGVFPDLDFYAGQLARDPEVRRRIACCCAWGPELAGYLVEKGWFPPSQVVVTGTPRLDFYVDPWREASLRASAYAGDLAGPLVLINGNFNKVNPWIGKIRPPEKAANPYHYDPEILREQAERSRLCMEGLIGLTNRLAAALPEVTFVYRPHPFERPETYQGRLDPLPNLHLIKRGSVEGWILRSSAVIQRGCATAIEATLSGVPAFSPAWLNTPAELAMVEAVSVSCASEAEMLERVREAVRQKPAVPEPAAHNLKSVIGSWFFQVDGRAAERVAAAIVNCGPGRVSLEACRRIADGVAGPAVPWSRHARSLLRRALGLPTGWSFRQWSDPRLEGFDRTPRYFGLDDVRTLVDVLQPAARTLYPSWRAVQVEGPAERSRGRSIAITPS